MFAIGNQKDAMSQMMTNDPRDPNDIRSIGIDLAPWGTYGWALTLHQSMDILDQFFQRGVPVLGGDVIYLIDNDFRYLGDNWTCNPIDGESHEVFVERSINRSRGYIQNYPEPMVGKAYFVIVPDQPPNPHKDWSDWLPTY
ncbi:MAG TPA: hypothetical protein DIS79_11360 [Bacteroidetes bacterium]|nr:hypothetical protein [Bacteroidota bacterium]